MKKIVTILSIVVVLGAIVGVVVYYSRTTSLTPSATQVLKYPPVFGSFVASTPASVTITIQGGTQKTFTVSSTTQIVTQVKSGEVGKTLAAISSGAQVLVQLSDTDKNAATRISIVQPPAPAASNPDGPPATYSGALLGTTTNSITIGANNEPNLRITVTKDTYIFSNVLAGQTGKSLRDVPMGTVVQVFGYVSKNGPVAHSIQLLVLLPH